MHPGYIWGDSVKIYFEMQAEARGGDTTWEDIYEERAAETVLRYLPHSSEIAGAVVFFASPLAKCVTGTVAAGQRRPLAAVERLIAAAHLRRIGPRVRGISAAHQ